MAQSKINPKIGAIRDDIFSAADTGLTEDKPRTTLPVLSNDAPSASLVALMTSQDNVPDANDPANALSALGAHVSIDKGGAVFYDGKNIKAILDSLAQGEILHDSFAYVAQLGKGALGSASVDVEITGVNDAPVVQQQKFFIADTAALDVPRLSLAASWPVIDPDHGAVVKFTANTVTTPLGTLTIDASGATKFDANVDGINALHKDEIGTMSVPVSAIDEFGAVGMGSFDLVVAGANDTATITGDLVSKISISHNLSTAGTVHVKDADLDESSVGALSVLTGKSAEDGSLIYTPAASVEGMLVANGHFGVLTMNPATGEWHYDCSSGVLHIPPNQAFSDRFQVWSYDQGTMADLTIYVIGVNQPTQIGLSDE